MIEYFGAHYWTSPKLYKERFSVDIMGNLIGTIVFRGTLKRRLTCTISRLLGWSPLNYNFKRSPFSCHHSVLKVQWVASFTIHEFSLGSNTGRVWLVSCLSISVYLQILVPGRRKPFFCNFGTHRRLPLALGWDVYYISEFAAKCWNQIVMLCSQCIRFGHYSTESFSVTENTFDYDCIPRYLVSSAFISRYQYASTWFLCRVHCTTVSIYPLIAFP